MSEPKLSWNDETMTNELLSVVPQLVRRPLDQAQLEAPTGPGIYLQFFATRSTVVERALSPLIAHGSYVAYVGVGSKNVKSRINRYRQSIDGLPIDEDEIHLAVLACPSPGMALWAERTLLDRLRPVLAGSGWGSKVPGAKRTGQKCSPADALIPGRRWAARPTPLDTAQAHMRVLSNLARLDPSGPRWLPLVI